jgi:hypothetical protein
VPRPLFDLSPQHRAEIAGADAEVVGEQLEPGW